MRIFPVLRFGIGIGVGRYGNCGGLGRLRWMLGDCGMAGDVSRGTVPPLAMEWDRLSASQLRRSRESLRPVWGFPSGERFQRRGPASAAYSASSLVTSLSIRYRLARTMRTIPAVTITRSSFGFTGLPPRRACTPSGYHPVPVQGRDRQHVGRGGHQVQRGQDNQPSLGVRRTRPPAPTGRLPMTGPEMASSRSSGSSRNGVWNSPPTAPR